MFCLFFDARVSVLFVRVFLIWCFLVGVMFYGRFLCVTVNWSIMIRCEVGSLIFCWVCLKC